MAWLLKKKKPKAKLEIPPLPEMQERKIPENGAEIQPESTPGKIDIPDKFHEVKFPKEEIEIPETLEGMKPREEPLKFPETVPEGEKEDLFKPVSDVAKPEIPEMPELPEIPELGEKEAMELKPAMPEGPVFVKSRDFQDVLVKIGKIK